MYIYAYYLNSAIPQKRKTRARVKWKMTPTFGPEMRPRGGENGRMHIILGVIMCLFAPLRPPVRRGISMICIYI